MLISQYLTAEPVNDSNRKSPGGLFPPFPGNLATGGVLCKSPEQVIRHPADDLVFPQIPTPQFRHGLFSIEDAQNVAGDRSRGVAVPVDVHGCEYPLFKFALMIQRTVDADGERLFRNPAFAEFRGSPGAPGRAECRKSFGGPS